MSNRCSKPDGSSQNEVPVVLDRAYLDSRRIVDVNRDMNTTDSEENRAKLRMRDQERDSSLGAHAMYYHKLQQEVPHHDQISFNKPSMLRCTELDHKVLVQDFGANTTFVIRSPELTDPKALQKA